MTNVPTTAAHVGSQVKRARIAAGLTQVELAAKLGVSQHQISKFESQQSLTTVTLEKIARSLGVIFEVGG